MDTLQRDVRLIEGTQAATKEKSMLRRFKRHFRFACYLMLMLLLHTGLLEDKVATVQFCYNTVCVIFISLFNAFKMVYS